MEFDWFVRLTSQDKEAFAKKNKKKKEEKQNKIDSYSFTSVPML